MCCEKDIDKSFAIAGCFGRQVDSMLTTPTEACDADWEICGLRLAEFREEIYDTRHCDTHAVLDQMGSKAVDRTDKIVPIIYQRSRKVTDMMMNVIQIFEEAHKRFGSHGCVQWLYHPEWASIAYCEVLVSKYTNPSPCN